MRKQMIHRPPQFATFSRTYTPVGEWWLRWASPDWTKVRPQSLGRHSRKSSGELAGTAQRNDQSLCCAGGGHVEESRFVGLVLPVFGHLAST